MDSIHSSTPHAPETGAFKAWWLAIRPKTLTLSVVPVMVGTSLAWAESGNVAWLPALAALLAAVFIQAGTNLHNDAGDFERGADRPDRLGPLRAAASGWLTARAIRAGAYTAFAAAFFIGIYLAWLGGWPIVAVGLLSIAAGLAYTGGRRPIAYTATGELFVFLFFGIAAVAGTYYLQTLHITGRALVAGAAVGMFAAAVLVVNNYRDMDTDRQANKNTLASWLGRSGTRLLYGLLVIVPFPASLFLTLEGGGAFWLPWLALPPAVGTLLRFLHEPPGPVFNRLLAWTAQLQLAYGLLLSAAWVSGRW